MTINDHIRQRYPHEPTDLIARDLNISIRQVYNRAYSMGLNKTDEYIRTHQPGWADLKERGKNTRFKKGDTPHNKGVPMSSDVYERVKNTMFKKGGKPHNTQPVGTINWRMDKEGRNYAYIKIKDRDWRLMHRVVWEQHNGPIPPCHIIRFKDGNTMNWDINNLEMLHQSGNMELNTIQRFPAEIQEVMKLNSKLKKKINGKKQNQ
jgi:hypothetical protein